MLIGLEEYTIIFPKQAKWRKSVSTNGTYPEELKQSHSMKHEQKAQIFGFN